MIRYRHLILFGLGLPVMSCGSYDKVRSPTTDSEFCAFPADTAIARLEQMATGCENLRTPAPPNSSAAIMIWTVDEQGNPQRQIDEICTRGQSVLPDSNGLTLYLVNAGLLYSIDRHTGQTRQVSTTGVADWQFSQVLGFSRQSSQRSGGFQVLVEMINDSATPPRRPWLLTVQGTTATGVMLQEDDPRIQDPQTMEQHFLIPRCKDGYRSCLVVTQSRSVGLEPRRGEPIELLKPPAAPPASTTPRPDLVVIDTAWMPDPKQMLVLAEGCPAAKQTQPANPSKP